MKRVTGGIDISALNVPPEKHEYSTAVFFAKRGKDVVFIKPSDIKKQHTMWDLVVESHCNFLPYAV